MADQFRNVRLKTNQSAIVVETIQKRKPILVNSVDRDRYPMARQFDIRSLLAVPLLMFDGAIGPAVVQQPGSFACGTRRLSDQLSGQLKIQVVRMHRP